MDYIIGPHQWSSPGKINLFLYITGQRSDHYHLLQTLFQFLDYSDRVTILANASGRIRLFSSRSILNNENNLIICAAKLLQTYCWPTGHAPGANIVLHKILPIGGGLGGGSSNAATTLVGLNYHWKCNLSLKTLIKLSLKLGSDVPFFVCGRSSFSESIGESLTSINISERWYLIFVPNISISTQIVFNIPSLKRNSIRLSIQKLFSKPFSNDCEFSVKKFYPVINRYFMLCLHYTGLVPRLTGTGSCMFLEFDTEKDAKYIQSLVPLWMKNFIAKGINFSPLHYELHKMQSMN